MIKIIIISSTIIANILFYKYFGANSNIIEPPTEIIPENIPKIITEDALLPIKFIPLNDSIPYSINDEGILIPGYIDSIYVPIPPINIEQIDYYIKNYYVFDSTAIEFLEDLKLIIINNPNFTLDQLRQTTDWRAFVTYLSTLDTPSKLIYDSVLNESLVEEIIILDEIIENTLVSVIVDDKINSNFILEFLYSDFGIKCIISISVISITLLLIHLLITYYYKTTYWEIYRKLFN